MSEYQSPGREFSAQNVADTIITEAGLFRDQLIVQYRKRYEAFWRTPRTHGDKALTMEQAQAVIDEAPQTVATIRQNAEDLITAYESIYPEAFEGDNPKMPERYKSAAYEYEINPEGRIVLLSLKPEWEAQ